MAYQTLFSAFGSKVLLAQAMVAAGWPPVEDALKLVAESRASGDPVRWLRTTALVNRRINELCGDLVRFMRESGDPDLMSRYRAIELERTRASRSLASCWKSAPYPGEPFSR